MAPIFQYTPFPVPSLYRQDNALIPPFMWAMSGIVIVFTGFIIYIAYRHIRYHGPQDTEHFEYEPDTRRDLKAEIAKARLWIHMDSTEETPIPWLFGDDGGSGYGTMASKSRRGDCEYCAR
ncbi:hypothetical protein BU26DRAFT_569975 [Trematosphaeria pertusa]|uniref:Uncharacterized protein n=1 Tax=Trematosphaeria pertusa TaxID=390896 RepID=A0A6A6HZX1_9PLEO|nr:uncharacterized protein BU26DRAFT_569975 [Trematosphaeria pertusa]KAF2243272.1 hypothetical protein BU26DRAFT_569975 [Trematosphaeria pertusa]